MGERAMLEIGKRVIVIAENGIAYHGVIVARALGERNSLAYKIGQEGGGFEQAGQWHKASDVFVPEETISESLYSP